MGACKRDQKQLLDFKTKGKTLREFISVKTLRDLLREILKKSRETDQKRADAYAYMSFFALKYDTQLKQKSDSKQRAKP